MMTNENELSCDYWLTPCLFEMSNIGLIHIRNSEGSCGDRMYTTGCHRAILYLLFLSSSSSSPYIFGVCVRRVQQWCVGSGAAAAAAVFMGTMHIHTSSPGPVLPRPLILLSFPGILSTGQPRRKHRQEVEKARKRVNTRILRCLSKYSPSRSFSRLNVFMLSARGTYLDPHTLERRSRL